MIDLQELAEKKSFEVISTTSGTNGYSENVKIAIIGFESFSEAEELAAENNMEVMQFYRKAGWQLWERKDTVSNAITISSSDYGDDYTEWQPDIDMFLKILANCSDIEQIKGIIENCKELQDQYDCREEGEIVIATYNDAGYYTFVEVTKEEAMSFSNDSQQWTIGIINICE